MLVVRCANGFLVWIFRRPTPTTRAARCLADGFTVQYDATPNATWQTLAETIVTHSMMLRGAFQNMWLLEL
jgi:hypothetical protein